MSGINARDGKKGLVTFLVGHQTGEKCCVHACRLSAYNSYLVLLPLLF